MSASLRGGDDDFGREGINPVSLEKRAIFVIQRLTANSLRIADECCPENVEVQQVPRRDQVVLVLVDMAIEKPVGPTVDDLRQLCLDAISAMRTNREFAREVSI